MEIWAWLVRGARHARMPRRSRSRDTTTAVAERRRSPSSQPDLRLAIRGSAAEAPGRMVICCGGSCAGGSAAGDTQSAGSEGPPQPDQSGVSKKAAGRGETSPSYRSSVYGERGRSRGERDAAESSEFGERLSGLVGSIGARLVVVLGASGTSAGEAAPGGGPAEGA